MRDYYLDKIYEISALLNKREFDRAEKLIVEELTMPYLPAEFEKKILSLQAKIPSKTTKNLDLLSFEKLSKILLNDWLNNIDTYAIIELFNEFNLRNHIKAVEEILVCEQLSILLKFKLLEILKTQNIEEKFFVKFDHQMELIDLKKIIQLGKNKNYLYDLKETNNLTFKYPILQSASIQILQNYYLYSSYQGLKVEKVYLYILHFLADYFEEDELLSFIKDKLRIEKGLEENLNKILEIIKCW